MNILFHSNQLSERGTEVALFDYAMGNRNVLGNISFIASPKNAVKDSTILKKFKNHFEVYLYESTEELSIFAKNRNVDLLYQIVNGEKDKPVIDCVPAFIHCVFSTKAKYGTYYCPISDFLNKWYRTKYSSLS